MTRRVARMWMRMGDQGDYEDFDNPYEAGYQLGAFFEEDSRMPSVKRYGKYGVEVGTKFPGPYNYVSLFWGDEDAQPTKDITATDISHFKAGIADSADIRVTPRRRQKTSKSGSKKRSVSPSGLKGLR